MQLDQKCKHTQPANLPVALFLTQIESMCPNALSSYETLGLNTVQELKCYHNVRVEDLANAPLNL